MTRTITDGLYLKTKDILLVSSFLFNVYEEVPNRSDDYVKSIELLAREVEDD